MNKKKLIFFSVLLFVISFAVIFFIFKNNESYKENTSVYSIAFALFSYLFSLITIRLVQKKENSK